MTIQIWKTAGSEAASVTFTCPWCDVTGTGPVLGHQPSLSDEWLLVGCPAPDCRRGVLVRMARQTESWAELDTGIEGVLLDRNSILPPRLPSFRGGGVPPPIARGMEEALRCQALGQHSAAALVALAALETATQSLGARDRDPARAVRALAHRLSSSLLDFIDEISLLVERPVLRRLTSSEVDRLLAFVTEVLHQLFAVPELLAHQSTSQR